MACANVLKMHAPEIRNGLPCTFRGNFFFKKCTQTTEGKKDEVYRSVTVSKESQCKESANAKKALSVVAIERL